jgi:hypothetical protein
VPLTALACFAAQALQAKLDRLRKFDTAGGTGLMLQEEVWWHVRALASVLPPFPACALSACTYRRD